MRESRFSVPISNSHELSRTGWTPRTEPDIPRGEGATHEVIWYTRRVFVSPVSQPSSRPYTSRRPDKITRRINTHTQINCLIVSSHVTAGKDFSSSVHDVGREGSDTHTYPILSHKGYRTSLRLLPYNPNEFRLLDTGSVRTDR